MKAVALASKSFSLPCVSRSTHPLSVSDEVIRCVIAEKFTIVTQLFPVKRLQQIGRQEASWHSSLEGAVGH